VHITSWPDERILCECRERSQLIIEHFDILSAVCIELNSLEDSSSVFKHIVDSAPRFKGIDSAGIYVLDSSSGEFILEYATDLPGGFVDSHPGSRPGSELHEMLHCNETVYPCPSEGSLFTYEGNPQVFIKGLFPLIRSETALSVMFIASSEPGDLPQEIPQIMDIILAMAKATISRIDLESSARRSEMEHSLLLEGVLDPVFALGDNLEMKYCNGAFQQLVCFEEEGIEKAAFSEVAGLELTNIMRAKFDEAFNSDPGFRISTLEYRERVFNTFISRTPDGIFVLMNDISEAEQTRKKLNFRERFESLLITISTDFIKMRGSALNLGINDALLNIGVSIEVDRAYLFQFSDTLSIMNNTHEWCATNVQPQIENQQGLKPDNYPWLMNRLSRHCAFQVLSIPDLPTWAEAERELFESRNIQSLLVIPIVHGNNLIGYLGFDRVNHERYWSEDIIDLLRIVGDAIGNALVRNRMEKRLIEMYRRAEKEAQINAVNNATKHGIDKGVKLIITVGK